MDIFVVSDFNAELVSRYLSADRTAPPCKAQAAPYGQLYQSLSAAPPTGGDSFVFVWTRPEGAVSEWQAQLDGQSVKTSEILAGVDAYCDALIAQAKRCRLLLVANWVPSQAGRGLGMLDWSPDGNAARMAHMNLRLAERLDGVKNAFVLDAQRWIDTARPPRDSKFWYLAKTPFTEAVHQAASGDVKAAIRGATGQTRKLIVVDLDDTMWGGIVGDDGWQNLKIGGHDMVGEAHADFQRALLSLNHRGIVLAMVSKNTESTALEAVDKHPEMILRRKNFAGWRINWLDKATNIVELVKELNLGLQSVVFIDDNPVERGRVREALPEVLVPEWPKDPAHYADALRQLNCFDQSAITAEDRVRVEMYTSERSRRTSQTEFSSPEEWLQNLGIRVGVAKVTDINRKRVVQLANKTNQLNLATRRFTEEEFATWLGQQGHDARAVSVTDRFGDLGLTGVISWRWDSDALEITDYILSCRAMGRQVEELMAALVVEAAKETGKSKVRARLLPTDRNGPCLEFWRRSGFAEVEPHLFVWETGASYAPPSFITIDRS